MWGGGRNIVISLQIFILLIPGNGGGQGYDLGMQYLPTQGLYSQFIISFFKLTVR